MNYNDLELSGWNQFPKATCKTARPERISQLVPGTDETTIARGLGRSYGDAAINDQGQVLLTTRLNRILAFDQGTGLLRAEAGVSIDELIDLFLPRGWFLPVTPGTRYVTLGGCVANDVHGKNHHLQGSFSSCLRELTLIDAGGRPLTCSASENSQAYWATIGGLGLTGIIREVTIQLRRVESAYLSVDHSAGDDLDDLIDMMAEDDSEYTVAWIDCLSSGKRKGRGVYMQGRHMNEEELPPAVRTRPLIYQRKRTLSIPFNVPGMLLNRHSVKAFNAWYYKHESAKEKFISDYQHYFYPLDNLNDWYRLYGRKGFIQYQCVLPLESSNEGMHQILDALQKRGKASFLAVLKRLGPGNQAPLSFPIEGYTLAVDIPVSGKEALKLNELLNEITLEHDGRVYLAKDASMNPETFRRMYPRFPEWMEIKKTLDPEWHFESMLSRRLELHNG